MVDNAKISIFAGSAGQEFAERMCKYLNMPLGKSSVIRFSDGNVFVRADESVRDRTVYLVQPIGFRPNDEFTEILFWMDAFKRASAASVVLVMPYFGYAKGDKKDEPRVSIRARVCAECMELAGADRVMVMDEGKLVLDGTPKEVFSHVDELKRYRLDVPQVTELAWELKKEGVPLPDGILTIDEFADALCAAADKIG